eukprot:gnl/TRDRNA2_/TRDRNA2_122079_c4_seq1.p1 gnl/TRDRNA2_/TRDRNA2_122079_c4~~gnl/TRDRNA2_/TRDRNA2_122079_c4_seq1.p1  ORF type:complete len:472 (+),score=83.53 gnl/TRDRNA2_/TRDRNA2_122079_c4_seq1:170-1417(+)
MAVAATEDSEATEVSVHHSTSDCHTEASDAHVEQKHQKPPLTVEIPPRECTSDDYVPNVFDECCDFLRLHGGHSMQGFVYHESTHRWMLPTPLMQQMLNARKWLLERYGTFNKAFWGIDVNRSGSISLVEIQERLTTLHYPTCSSYPSIRQLFLLLNAAVKASCANEALEMEAFNLLDDLDEYCTRREWQDVLLCEQPEDEPKSPGGSPRGHHRPARAERFGSGKHLTGEHHGAEDASTRSPVMGHLPPIGGSRGPKASPGASPAPLARNSTRPTSAESKSRAQPRAKKSTTAPAGSEALAEPKAKARPARKTTAATDGDQASVAAAGGKPLLEPQALPDVKNLAVPKASASRKSTVGSAGEKSLLEPKAPPVRKSKVSSAGEKPSAEPKALARGKSAPEPKAPQGPKPPNGRQG